MLVFTILQGQMNLSREKIIRLPHLPYSPDLAPFDFYLFGMLKENLKNYPGRMFDELKQKGNQFRGAFLRKN
jgi:hypothetical protein